LSDPPLPSGPEKRAAGIEAGGIYRDEALQARAASRNDGQLLHLSPTWIRWSYWLLLAVLFAAVLYTSLGTVHEYASGPAMIHFEGRTNITARSEGIVASVLVAPGQRVQANDLLVRFYLAKEGAELERTQREFDLQLVKLLRDPSDQAALQSLASLRAEVELAQTRLDDRSIRAPHAGIVSDIRIRAGQYLAPGEVLLALLDEGAPCSIVAILPGSYRPMLRAGMTLRFALSGFPYAYRETTIDWVGDEVVGPAEIKRYLGQELGDSVQIKGSAVLVGAKLPSRTFVANDTTLEYHYGMQGTAEARVRSERILFTLIPGLRILFG
jgi:membrane fusion protein (multidrug efflux system)